MSRIVSFPFIFLMISMLLITELQCFHINRMPRLIQSRLRSIPLRVSRDEQINLLYDSHCPICMMEVEFLRKRDLNERIRFTDLQSPDYNPKDHGGVKFEDGMRKIRAILPGDRIVTGIEVFRETYKAIGLGWMFALTSFPIIGNMADALYDVWAENRLRLTGRGDLADILKDRSDKLKEAEPIDCEEECALYFDDDDDNEAVTTANVDSSIKTNNEAIKS